MKMDEERGKTKAGFKVVCMYVYMVLERRAGCVCVWGWVVSKEVGEFVWILDSGRRGGVGEWVRKSMRGILISV